MKIFAIGMNYSEHNKSLHGTLSKTSEPVIFLKADSALLKDGKPFFIPDDMGRIEYETEVVVRICRLGKTIPNVSHIGITMPLRWGLTSRHANCRRNWKEQGHPWELSKSFDGAAVLGSWVDKERFLDIQRLRFHLDINGKTVQQGCTCDMLYKIDEVISYISRYFTLKTGDLLYTGCPTDCGPVQINDHLEGYIEDRKVLDFRCK